MNWLTSITLFMVGLLRFSIPASLAEMSHKDHHHVEKRVHVKKPRVVFDTPQKYLKIRLQSNSPR